MTRINLTLQKILDQLSDLTFLSLNKTGFQYGPPGRLLLRNLENLWFQQCVTKPSYNVFLTSIDKSNDALKYVKSFEVDFLPFGLAILEHTKSKYNQWMLDSSNSVNLMHKIGKVVIFTDAIEVKDVFHVKQRERKIWWRKLACKPSRFTVTEIKKSKNYDAVDIEAQFPFGNIIIETIKCYHDIQKLIPQDLINAFDLTETKAVEHVASMDWGSMALLCDGHKEDSRTFDLRLHPRLSPYKVTFSAAKINCDSDSTEKDLNELILYLNNLLRSNGINTILTKNQQNNQTFQVPFVVNVDQISLKNGIIRVNSKFTTLDESVHITGLIEHISSRCL